ncbi:hypothetical protein JTE90_020050 [Oedothorax gibbosus]|uniref:DUF4371 domain-containing protein n=1 Tax=Oedothorax gibbosus TaxID=931172 RepID=A0AAV6UU48_9ARAC|nr:hypothetical protein JTE90_020050 [Oedothorax gibbosus]
MEKAFLSVGFRKWKNGVQSFKKHEKSDYHQQSVHINVQRAGKPPITTLLSSQIKKDQEEARAALRVIISSLRYLVRTGQATRGHEHDGGNLRALIEERNIDVPLVRKWIERRDNWLSGDIQNELIQIMAHSIQRDLLKEIRRSPFFGLIADATTDASGKEQLSLCIRCVEPQKLTVKELLSVS